MVDILDWKIYLLKLVHQDQDGVQDRYLYWIQIIIEIYENRFTVLKNLSQEHQTKKQQIHDFVRNHLNLQKYLESEEQTYYMFYLMLKIEFIEYISELLDRSSIYYKYYKQLLESSRDWDVDNMECVLNQCINQNPKESEQFKVMKQMLE